MEIAVAGAAEHSDFVVFSSIILAHRNIPQLPSMALVSICCRIDCSMSNKMTRIYWKALRKTYSITVTATMSISSCWQQLGHDWRVTSLATKIGQAP